MFVNMAHPRHTHTHTNTLSTTHTHTHTHAPRAAQKEVVTQRNHSHKYQCLQPIRSKHVVVCPPLSWLHILLPWLHMWNRCIVFGRLASFSHTSKPACVTMTTSQCAPKKLSHIQKGGQSRTSQTSQAGLTSAACDIEGAH